MHRGQTIRRLLVWMPGVRSSICRRLSAESRQGKPKPEIGPAKSPSRGHQTGPESVVLTGPVSLIDLCKRTIFCCRMLYTV